jgi:hypothetical protein
MLKVNGERLSTAYSLLFIEWCWKLPVEKGK